jgi:hypothetical protein
MPPDQCRDDGNPGVILPITSRWHAHACGQWTDSLAGDRGGNWEFGPQKGLFYF